MLQCVLVLANSAVAFADDCPESIYVVAAMTSSGPVYVEGTKKQDMRLVTLRFRCL